MRRISASLGLALAPAAAFAADTDKKGMPQLDPSTYPSQIFWLAVFFVAFYLFMKFVAMPRLHRILEARAARISDDLGHATVASGDAHELKTALEASLSSAREQARGLLAAANDEIRKEATLRETALSTELNARIEKAEAAIAAARDQALGSIEDIAVNIVVDALPKLASVSASEGDIRAAVSRAAGGKV